jgi:hypothetical protein
MRNLANPAIAANIAALLAAVGVNVYDQSWQFVIEILAMIFAVAGIAVGFWRSRVQPPQAPLMEPSNRQKT